jgi:hypothetical protein
MPVNTIEILKKHLESNIGDLGTTIFNQSVSKLDISTNPTRQEFETLILSLEKTVEKLYGTMKSSLIFNNFRNELIKYDLSYDKFFSSRFDENLDNSVEKKGVLGESEIHEISGSIISKGCDCEEEQLVVTIKRLVKKRIIHDLNEDIISDDVKSFVDTNPFYSQMDIELFKIELNNKKIEINDIDLKNIFEKERLIRKFNFIERTKSEDDKILTKYSQLFDPEMKNEYEYILTDAKIISMMKKNRYLKEYFKRPTISHRLRNSYQ